jgi:hypothetical protein
MTGDVEWMPMMNSQVVGRGPHNTREGTPIEQ